MSLVLVLALGVLLLAVLLLASLLRLEAVFGDHEGGFRLYWTALTFGFDARAKELSLSLFSRWVYRKRTDEKRPAKPRKEKKPRRSIPVRKWLEERDTLRAQFRYLLRHVSLERLDAKATIATPDPSLTGMLYGLAASLSYPLSALSPKVALNITPDFVGERPSGRFDAALSIRVFYLVVIGWHMFWLNRRLQRS